MANPTVTKPSLLEVEARSYELDPYGHLNNSVYANWLEHGRLVFLRDRGETYTSIPERYGVHVVVVRQELDYSEQVRLSDRLRITTRIVRFGNSSFAFEQAVDFLDGRLDGRPAARGLVTMVCVGPDGRSCPMPAALRSCLDT